MKWLKRIILALVAIVVIALTITYFSLNSIIRNAVQSQSQASLNVPTSLDSAKLAIFGGSVSLKDFEISSPPNFNAPKLLTLDGASVTVSYGDLRNTPIHIKQVTIDGPKLVVERNAGKLNLQALMDLMPKTQSNAEPMKVIINDLVLSNAVVDFQMGVPGLPNDIPVPVPSLEIKNIGNADGSQNGAAVKDVVMQVATALAGKASQDGKLPLDINSILQANLAGISQKLGGQFNTQFQAATGNFTKNLPSGVSNLINGAATQQSDNLQKNLTNLLGPKKK